MDKIKRVKTIEVKRTYLIAGNIRRSDKEKTKKDYLGKIDKDTFLKKLKTAKSKILKLKEEDLDKMIASTYVKRLVAFNNSDWYIGTFKPSEVGVWRRAGTLPLEWTNKSLEETAKYVSKGINNKSKKLVKRAQSAIPNILDINVNLIQKEKYLLPIVFKGGTGTRGRKRLKSKMAGDIDDGCMRSIALTIAGAKKINAYLGFPKKK